MIRDLSLSLRNLLVRGSNGFPELASARIAFDRPADSFNPAQPTISLYLYDIRENTELRTTEPDIQIVGGRAVMRRSAMRVACSYVVTAWPGNVTGDELALSEQRLLSQALAVFWRHPQIPETYLVGSMVGQAPRLPLITAQAEGLRNPSEFWTALNNRMRPSLNLGVTFSMSAIDAVTAPLALSSEIVLRHDTDVVSDRFRIGGRVLDGADAAVHGAAVVIPTLGLSATTDADGRFVLGPIAAGAYTLRVQQGMVEKSVAIRVPAPDADGYDVKLS